MRRAAVLIAAIGASGGALASAAAAATPNSWRQAAPMTTARFGQAEAALSGDRVLLAGGEDGQFNDLKSATIYNAASDTWTPAADMGTPRIAPGAVTLPSGKVLVVGGGNPAALTNALDTGEVYDPGTDSWAPVTNTMSSARGQGPVTMLLTTGKVLIAGGADGNGHPLATADLYDPDHNTFTPTGSMGTARSLDSAAPLASGKVLVAGGLTAGPATSQTADVYDPGTGTWAAVANAMSAERAYPGAAVLPNGKVLVAGGQSITGPSTTASTDIYDPATNRFTPGPAMNAPRAGFGVVSLPAGQPLVIGGLAITNGNDTLDPKAQLYNPSTNTWASVAASPRPKALGTAVRLADGDILWAGGFDNDNPLGDAELYTPPALLRPPTSVSATPGNGSATVVFTAPASDGGLPVLHYTVTASTGQTATTPDARTFATVSGLTNAKPVTFTVTATTALGTGGASAASSATTPSVPAPPIPAPKLKLAGLKTKLKLSAFLKGVTFTAAPDRTASLQVSLLASVKRATIARAFPLVLATKTFGASAKKRTFTIVPSSKLVGRPRHATVLLTIVATGSTGRQTTITKQITVTR